MELKCVFLQNLSGIIAATLVLNWKEDGEVFVARMDRHKSNEEEIKPPLSMDRWCWFRVLASSKRFLAGLKYGYSTILDSTEQCELP